MKKLLLLLFIIPIISLSQNDSYEQRKAAIEARKEAKYKRKNEYRAKDGKVFKVGDTLTVYGKLHLFDGVYKGKGAMEYQHRFIAQKDVQDIQLIIKEFRNDFSGEMKIRAICKGIDKGYKGTYTVYIEEALQLCEIRRCK